MRQKFLPSRVRRSSARTHPAESTADWLIENELGWGLPHALFAVLAMVLLAARALGWEMDRLSAWLDRRHGAGGRPA